MGQPTGLQNQLRIGIDSKSGTRTGKSRRTLDPIRASRHGCTRTPDDCCRTLGRGQNPQGDGSEAEAYQFQYDPEELLIRQRKHNALPPARGISMSGPKFNPLCSTPPNRQPRLCGKGSSGQRLNPPVQNRTALTMVRKKISTNNGTGGRSSWQRLLPPVITKRTTVAKCCLADHTNLQL